MKVESRKFDKTFFCMKPHEEVYGYIYTEKREAEMNQTFIIFNLMLYVMTTIPSII